MLFLPSSNEWYVFLTVIGNCRNFQEDRSRKKERSYPGLFGIYKIIPSYESHASAQYYATSLIIPLKLLAERLYWTTTVQAIDISQAQNFGIHIHIKAQ